MGAQSLKEFREKIIEKGFTENNSPEDYLESLAVLTTFYKNYRIPIQIIVANNEDNWFKNILMANDIIEGISDLNKANGPLLFGSAANLKPILEYKEIRKGIFAVLEEAIYRTRENFEDEKMELKIKIKRLKDELYIRGEK